MSDNLRPREQAFLTHVNSRRFEILLYAATLPPDFTSKQIKAAITSATARIISMDLEILEKAEFLTASPPLGQPRQGKAVFYRVATDVPELLEGLAARARQAWDR